VQPGFSTPYAFSITSVRANAPATSGVYGLTNASEWIYIGQTDNIQKRLLEHIVESDSQLKARNPTGFTYQVCAESVRADRQDQLILQYKPVCNRKADGGRMNRAMTFTLTGFSDKNGVRRFAFDCHAADRSRTTVFVGADIGMARKHEIRLQELPLICVRLLESLRDDALTSPVTLTEDNMIEIQTAARSEAERRSHKAPRRP